MRMMARMRFDTAMANAAVKSGSVEKTFAAFIEKAKPEAVYFTDHCGKRSAVVIVDLPDASKIPSLAEPWFLTFEADVQIHPIMTPADLEKAGLDAIGKKWS